MLLALASILSLQLEAGGVAMQHAPDDIYYDGALKHSIAFDTAAFGAGVRLDTGDVQLSVGWRNLGYTKVNSDIIGDQQYFNCRAKPATCPAPAQFWHSTGNEQQAYLEAGYAFRFGSWRLVPSVGIAETKIQWHGVTTNLHGVDCAVTCMGDFTSKTQHVALPFAGLTLQHGNWGVGVYWLDTGPNTDVSRDSDYPGQGKSAVYLRATYALPVLK